MSQPSLEAVFAEVFAIPREGITDALDLRDIPTWDSMSHMLLVVRLEQDFATQLTGDEIADLRTVADARRALRSRGLLP